MNIRKIIIPLIILIGLVILATIAMTTDLGQSGGADMQRGVSIESIEFNVPDGYEKNNSKTVVNQTKSNGSTSLIYTEEVYENGAGDEIRINIADYDYFDVNADNLYKICEGRDRKTLLGYPGYLSGNESFTCFTYAFNNKAVSITAPDEDLIKQVLVVEDS